MPQFILILAILSVGVFVTSTMLIFAYLKSKNEDVSFLWIRLFMIAYANKYKRLTKEETGKVGPLFYYWIISINVALVCAVLLLLLATIYSK